VSNHLRKTSCCKVLWPWGQRPEELQNALIQLQSRSEDPYLVFPIICATLASVAAELEIATVESLGTLASVIFDRIVHGNEDGESKLFLLKPLRITRSKLVSESIQHRCKTWWTG
jgi:hypothetical protein